MTPDIKRILVPVDFSAHSRRALDYAHALARTFDAALHLLHVCDVPRIMMPALDAYAIAYSDSRQRLGEEAERELLKLKGAFLDVTATIEVLFGRPASSIVDAADANDADLIVMGTHGHGAVMHLLMGNVAERVVRTAACPVLTVPEPKPLKERATARPKLAVMAASVLAGMLLAPGWVVVASAQAYKIQSLVEFVGSIQSRAWHQQP